MSVVLDASKCNALIAGHIELQKEIASGDVMKVLTDLIKTSLGITFSYQTKESVDLRNDDSYALSSLLGSLELLSSNLHRSLKKIRNKTRGMEATTSFYSLEEINNRLKLPISYLERVNWCMKRYYWNGIPDVVDNETSQSIGLILLDSSIDSKELENVLKVTDQIRLMLQQIRNNLEDHLEIVEITKECRLQEEAKKQALIDPVTWLNKRIKYESQIDWLIKEEAIFDLIYWDLNHLKEINDTLGHWVGDLYLKAFANFLKDSFREDDFFARLGGDEFVIIPLLSSNLSYEDLIKRSEFEFTISKKFLNIEKRIEETKEQLATAKESNSERLLVSLIENILSQLEDDTLTEIKFMGSVAVGMVNSEEDENYSKESVLAIAEARMQSRKNEMKQRLFSKGSGLPSKSKPNRENGIKTRATDLENKGLKERLSCLIERIKKDGWCLVELDARITEVLSIFQGIINDKTQKITYYRDEFSDFEAVIKWQLNTARAICEKHEIRGLNMKEDLILIEGLEDILGNFSHSFNIAA